MKQVYEVRVEIDVYVVAEDEDEACREGIYAVRHGDESSAFEVSAEPLGTMKRPKGVMRSLPYNAPNERRHWTIEEWGAAKTPEEEVDTRTLPLFPAPESRGGSP